MREIKFRAWDKEFKKFSEKALMYSISDINFLTDYKWMQYTGLKDKNGKEIYEGDILRTDSGQLYEVIWYNCGFATRWLLNNSECYLIKGFADITEIIGNVYESNLSEV